MRRSGCVCVLAALVALGQGAAAAEPSEQPASPEALAAFVEGTEHVKQAHWAQALAAFERANKAQSHPITTYNIGACERALGMYARARVTFQRALREHEASGSTALPAALVERAHGFLAQIDDLLARVHVRVSPDRAAFSVDGRPLARGDRGVFVAGVRPPGKAELVPTKSFVMLVDPGAHVITLSRSGFAPAVLNRTFAPGAKVELAIRLDRLPATLQIRSRPAGAIVKVQDKDVGPTPLDLSRPAGVYRVEFDKDGYVPYETRLKVAPGQRVTVLAPLAVDEPTIFERWWFWTIAGAALTGVAVGTYFAVRPEPEETREEVTGGSFGKIRVP